MKDKQVNDDQLTPFSGELEIEDLEFLSEEQHEMVAGGFGFGINTTGGFPLSIPSIVLGKISKIKSIFSNIFD